ncbi:hypothetical protein HMPREF1545_03602 [Oscillibacter sp. KLE 1728]|nr:hypothetical protein HMPREF1545_03602 [Oscillibacter sp. KLE 1728]
MDGWAGRAAERRPQGSGSRRGALSMRDAPPIFFLRHQKENAPRPVEKKTCSAGRSAQAQTSCRRLGKVGNPARRSETETPGPWGTLQPGDVRDTSSFSFRCRWPVVDESLRSGPMRASASTNARAARSEAERAEREAGQMRSCTPTPSAPSATGRQYRPHRRPKRARRQGQIGAGTGTPTPVRAEGHCTGARPAPFSLTPGAARSLFGATKKRMGGALPSWHPS